MEPPVRVDVYGLPGSGKTSIKDHVCSERSDVHGIREGYTLGVCRRFPLQFIRSLCQNIPLEILEAVARFGGIQSDFENDVFVQRAKAILNRYTDDTDREATVMRWLHDLVRRWETVTKFLGPDETVLCDEGFLMRANAIFSPPEPIAPLDRNHIEEYIAHMPEPDLVVLLDIPVTESESRILNRADGPPVSFLEQDRRARRQRLERMKQFTEYAAAALESSDIPFIRCRTDGQFNETIERFEQAIQPSL